MTLLQTNRRYPDAERLSRYSLTASILQYEETNIMTASRLHGTGKLADDRTLPATVSEMWRDKNAINGWWEYKPGWSDEQYVNAINSRRILMDQAGIHLNGPGILTRNQIYVPTCPTKRQMRNIAQYNRNIKNFKCRDIGVEYIVTKILPPTTYEQLQWIGKNENLVRSVYSPDRVNTLYIMYNNDQQHFSGKVPRWVSDIYIKTRRIHEIS